VRKVCRETFWDVAVLGGCDCNVGLVFGSGCNWENLRNSLRLAGRGDPRRADYCDQHSYPGLARCKHRQEGLFQIPGLLTGNYKVTAEHPGFRGVVGAEQKLLINEALRIDFKMQLANLAA
jgi:hypothetical protein